MAIKDWTTSYPTSTDSTTEMPDLVDYVDEMRVSQIHSVRDAVMVLETLVGDDTLASGTLRQQASLIESRSYLTIASGTEPAYSTGLGNLYVGSQTGNTELYYQDDLGSSTQVTSSGVVYAESLFDSPLIAGSRPIWTGSKFVTGFTDDFDDYSLHSRWIQSYGAGSSITETDHLSLYFAPSAAPYTSIYCGIDASLYVTIECHVELAAGGSTTEGGLLLQTRNASDTQNNSFYVMLVNYFGYGAWTRAYGNSVQVSLVTDSADTSRWLKLKLVGGVVAYAAQSSNAHTNPPIGEDWQVLSGYSHQLDTTNGRLIQPNTLVLYGGNWSGSTSTFNFRHLKIYYG